MNFVILLQIFLPVVTSLSGTYIDPDIPRRLGTTGTTTVIISFTGSPLDEVKKAVELKSFSSRELRIQAVYEALQEHSKKSQRRVQTLLREKISDTTFDIRHLWISHQMIVRNATEDAIELLAKSPDVSAIHADIVFPLLDQSPAEDQTPDDELEKYHNSSVTLSWGISKIKAPLVWAKGIRGQGVVVANIDTGVRRTHEALRNNYRDDYGWYDPYERTDTPKDIDGHGTHTMGTLAGQTKGIGVAPGAKWIACRGCYNVTSCTCSALLECGQWITCPSDTAGGNRNCSMAPNIVSNSWMLYESNDWFQPVLKAWKMLGIVSVFLIGNTGSSCQTTRTPGNDPLTIGVGSTTSKDYPSNFSSVGPAPNGIIKPDIAAPGSQIISASHLSDTDYALDSGTSMACPHVAGVAALLLSASPNLSVSQVESVIKSSGLPTTPMGKECGGIADNVYPNNHVGYGRICASLALSKF